VSQQLLDGADVVAVFQQVGGEGMTEGWHVAGFGMPPRRTASSAAGSVGGAPG
jgi:hypothetical protein